VNNKIKKKFWNMLFFCLLEPWNKISFKNILAMVKSEKSQGLSNEPPPLIFGESIFLDLTVFGPYQGDPFFMLGLV